MRRAVAKNSLNGTRSMIKEIRTKTGVTVTEGTFIVDLGNGAEAATTANTASADVILGICYKTITVAAANQLTKYGANIDLIVTVPYTAGTKTSLTAADVGTLFQLTAGSAFNLDLDNTTNPFMEVVGFNNDAGTADVLLHNRKQGVL